MNTHVTVSVSTSAVNALKCAYNALRSFSENDSIQMEENIYSIYGDVTFRYVDAELFNKKIDTKNIGSKHHVLCIITIKPIDSGFSEVTLAANMIRYGGYNDDLAGRTNAFAAEFLKRFSQELKDNDL